LLLLLDKTINITWHKVTECGIDGNTILLYVRCIIVVAVSFARFSDTFLIVIYFIYTHWLRQ